MLPPLDEAAKQRLRRFVGAAAMLWYTRKTITSLHENHAQLRLQSAHQGDSDGSLAGRVLRYTFMGQLISSMEYLIPLVKPVLAVRIARLLAGQGRDVVSNLEYGPHPRNMLDLYGTGSHVRRRPVVLFVHGGAWSFGHKWQYGLVGHYLAKHGFLVGVINYRTYPTGNVQDQVQDVEAAVRWLVDHAEEYGGDRDRIFVSGHSSGAHVTALALAQSAMREGEPASSATVGSLLHRQVQGFIGLAGPYDIAEHFVFEANRKVGPFDGVHEISSMKPAMLGEDKFDECSPTRLFQDIRASDVMLPSFHIIHGNADEVVPASSSRKLADSLRQSGHHAEYIELDGCTHEDILFAAMGDNVASKPELVAHYKRIAQIDAFPPTPSVSLPLLAKL